jgi:hypothetical protein
MKKIMMMVALVATALFTVTACGSDDDNNSSSSSNSGTTVTLTAPPYKNVATALTLANNTENIRDLRLMESGGYMLSREVAAARATRAGGGKTFEFGKFTYSGGVFTLDNGAKITITPGSGSNYNVKIQWKNGTTIETTAIADLSASVTAGTQTDNLCSRPWTIEALRIKGTYNGINLAKDFTGPINLANVKAWYESNYGTLKDKFDDNCIISGIYFDSKGLFAINYQNRDSDVGVWRWTSINSGELNYSWYEPATAISLFTGAAAVEFTQSPEKCKLTLKGKVDSTDLEFIFTMK